MNDCNNSMGAAVKPAPPVTTISAKHEELAAAVRYLDKFEKDLAEINERLQSISTAVNPEDYFGNHKNLAESEGLKDSQKDGVSPVRRYQDGLVGAMDTHIHQLNARIATLQAGISLVMRHLYYLQEQI
jgi:hypothetical protein